MSEDESNNLLLPTIINKLQQPLPCRNRMPISTIIPQARQLRRKNYSEVSQSSYCNLVYVPLNSNFSRQNDVDTRREFVPSILLTNVMSLVPKIDEIRIFSMTYDLDLFFITETWLKSTINDNHAALPGYNLERMDRRTGQHGGVCLFSKVGIKTTRLSDIESPTLEVMWVHVRPARLPRGVPCIVTATIYHPPSADDTEMLEYLSTSLTDIEGLFPGCGIIIAGDFNRLKIQTFCRNFSLKQLVQIPTRGTNTLDLVITNLQSFYQFDSIISHPPFGLSDHYVITIQPRQRDPKPNYKKVVYKRDTRPSRKAMFGRYLSQIDWGLLETIGTCEEKNNYLTDIINTGLTYIMPEKRLSFHHSDFPWINEDFKRLIQLRQRAFVSGNVTLFKFYRNKVNRIRKSCRATFYKSKVENLKQLNPKQWWREVKRISGMLSSSTLRDCIQIENSDHLSSVELANLINNSFLEPMKDFQVLNPADNLMVSHLGDQDCDIATPWSTYKKLKSLNTSKAPGPDDIPNFIFKEFAEVLAYPVSTLLNSSFTEQKLPNTWKLANITPIPKDNPVSDINKHLRPISLTCSMSKLAEEFVIEKYIAPAILETIDPNQYGGIPKSSATLALISMLHTWAKETDGTGDTVRVLLFDYRKAFDLIDHTILVNKIRQLPIPPHIVNWLISFLINRKQRVKLAKDCFSEWGEVPCGVPQGTKLGPWLFILMINDLKLTNFTYWKYIDDTTASETVQRNLDSQIQMGVNELETWTLQNKFQLHVQKCKELIIQFKKTRVPFTSVRLNAGCPNLVRHAKILGVTISDDLRWSMHITGIIKKANKRIFFIVQLKRAKIPVKEIINFYCTCVRPVLEYACEVFHFALPRYLSEAIERVQRRVTSIIFPGLPYSDRLENANLIPLSERRRNACAKLFHRMSNDPTHKLSSLLPERNIDTFDLRNRRNFQLPIIKTNRFLRSFIPACIKEFL